MPTMAMIETSETGGGRERSLRVRYTMLRTLTHGRGGVPGHARARSRLGPPRAPRKGARPG